MTPLGLRILKFSVTTTLPQLVTFLSSPCAAMACTAFLSSLLPKLSPESRILRDAESPHFQSSMRRWSNYKLKVPFAIVQPANENDVVHTVREAISASVPFVPASGRHSQ